MTPMSPVHHPPATASPPSSGGRLVTLDGRPLPFRGATIEADARGGLARVLLRQRFENTTDETLRVVYQMPLPADAAVSGYAFEVGERRVVGEVDVRRSARARFEEAIVEGHSAALLEQERSALFRQEIGNVPPHTAVTCEISLDQRLQWTDDGAWEWRFPTVVAPRYLGAPGRVPDAERIAVDVAAAGPDATATLDLRVRDALTGDAASPSHPIHARTDGDGVRIAFCSTRRGPRGTRHDEMRLDRDIVVRWPVAAAEPGVTLEVARPAADRPTGHHAYGLLTLTPPGAGTRHDDRVVPRDLIVLIDTSGSMMGAPLAHAKAVVLDVIASLRPHDRLEMIEFSDRPRRWSRGPQEATERARTRAAIWVESLQAGGGTEMLSGVRAALEPLRDEAQRQVLLVTDGQIGFERSVVGAVRTAMPRGCRLHAVGIGSAPNRSLTSAIARAGGGVEVLVGLDEDPAPVARRLVARTTAPLVVDVTLDGSAVADDSGGLVSDLMGGAPALVPVRLEPDGGELVVSARTTDGPWTRRLVVPASAPGTGSAAVPTTWAREAVARLEVDHAAGDSDADARIERIGLDHQIATRLTSWVAVSEEPTVDPRDPLRRVRVPQTLPYGQSIEGLGLRERSGSRAHRFAFGSEEPRFAFRGRSHRAMDFIGAAQPPTVPERLRGRLVRTGDRVVVIVQLDRDLDWSPPAAATLMPRGVPLRRRDAGQHVLVDPRRDDPGRTARDRPRDQARPPRRARWRRVCGGRPRHGRWPHHHHHHHRRRRG